jgi:acyl-CoA thioesterase FadM
MQEVLTATASVVLLDAKNRPIRIPDFFKRAVAKYHPSSSK